MERLSRELFRLRVWNSILSIAQVPYTAVGARENKFELCTLDADFYYLDKETNHPTFLTLAHKLGLGLSML